LPAAGMGAQGVIDELVRDVEGGLMGSTGGRFFGWVIGGTLPAALAADWLTSAWDQNAASNLTAPAEAVVEEVTGAWLKELLGLPAAASFGFVTGCQMAHVTALAAARHKLLRDRGWDVEAAGLCGAPRLRILATQSRHESMLRPLCLLGIGTDAVVTVPADAVGRMRMDGLAEALQSVGDQPTIVWLQAGDLNTGSFDAFEPACALARAARAWVHVDGAFGLWATTSDRYPHLLDGGEGAASWATDGHKWLNLPFASGFVFLAPPPPLRPPSPQVYISPAPPATPPTQQPFTPKWPPRPRPFPAYAAIRSLGRAGIASLVERCCTHARRLVQGIGRLPGAEIVAEP